MAEFSGLSVLFRTRMHERHGVRRATQERLLKEDEEPKAALLLRKLTLEVAFNLVTAQRICLFVQQHRIYDFVAFNLRGNK